MFFMLCVVNGFCQGNYVFPGSEFTLFGTMDLATPGSMSWATSRTTTPGYFSAYGTATITGASDANNINGYVLHYSSVANEGFVYPVGTGSDLRTLTTSGTISTGAKYGTAWILGNPGTTVDPTDGATHSVSALADDIASVSGTGEWDWVDVSGNGQGVTVSVSIPDVSAFSAASLLRLVGWNGSKWINLSTTQGSTAATGNVENNTLTGTMQSGITAIAIGRAYVTAYLKVFLQGAMVNSTTMTNYLTTSGFVSAAQPFNNSYFSSYAGTENSTLSSSATVTDWVLVELRSSVTGATVDKVAAFVKTDGTVIDYRTGATTLQFPNAIPGNYYIIVHHRDHLTVVSANTVSLPNTSATKYDFTTGLAKALDNGMGNSMKQVYTGVWAMWLGDYNHDQVVDNLDKSSFTTEFKQGLLDGYFKGDFNFDGIVDNLDKSIFTPVFLQQVQSPLF